MGFLADAENMSGFPNIPKSSLEMQRVFEFSFRWLRSKQIDIKRFERTNGDIWEHGGDGQVDEQIWVHLEDRFWE